MKALRMIPIVGLLLAVGCASVTPTKRPTSAARSGERAYAHQSCIQSERVAVCTGGPGAQLEGGQTCSCVDQKRVWGQSHSLLGVTN
jgi:hypothetical protein